MQVFGCVFLTISTIWKYRNFQVSLLTFTFILYNKFSKFEKNLNAVLRYVFFNYGGAACIVSYVMRHMPHLVATGVDGSGTFGWNSLNFCILWGALTKMLLVDKIYLFRYG